MSGELISLRMLLVGATPSEQNVWQQGATLASVPIEFEAAGSGPAACTMLAKGGVDICVIDANQPAADKDAVIGAARAVEPTPFVVVAAPRGTKRLEGSDGTLTKPAGQDDARKAVELCIRAKVPTRVLIVDDSGTIRSVVRKILSASRFAFDIHEAEEGAAALDQLRSGKFGMVFLDYNMPGLNGIETLLEIKREKRNIGVVMMTSTLDGALAERARAAGALAFLKKPFYPADIDTVLAHFYGLSAPLN